MEGTISLLLNIEIAKLMFVIFAILSSVTLLFYLFIFLKIKRPILIHNYWIDFQIHITSIIMSFFALMTILYICKVDRLIECNNNIYLLIDGKEKFLFVNSTINEITALIVVGGIPIISLLYIIFKKRY